MNPKRLCKNEEKRIANKWLEGGDYLVTAFPQKLYYHLKNLIMNMGFQIDYDKSVEPEIRTASLGYSEEVYGYITAETMPIQVMYPHKKFKILGGLYIILALILFVLAILASYSIISFISILLFIILLSLGIIFVQYQILIFESYYLQLWIESEQSETNFDYKISGRERDGSRLRIIIRVTKIYSKNKDYCRTIISNEIPIEFKQNFEAMLNRLKTEIPSLINASSNNTVENDEAIAKKLLNLKKLYDLALISKEEYETRRKDLVERL